MALPAGSRLGAYEIVGLLGTGGMGEVYRANDARLGRDVALKVLPPDVTGDRHRLERFDREARAIAALNHPHIVTIYSTEHVDGVRFLTMELVEGETLAAVIASGTVSLSRFLEIALALADALSAAHQKQITHRDLKPGNVMLSHDGRVKVLDFGLARIGGGPALDQSDLATIEAHVTDAGLVIGTMPYMSPEQVEGRPADPRSDLFSLGVVFYELLTGQRPFTGSSPAALMSSILRDTPGSLRAARDDIPVAVERLIERCLRKRAEDRIQSAREIYDELRRLQQDHHSGTSRVSSGSDRGMRAVEHVAEGEHSIGVLPFADLSATKDQDWFCDGIAEEILNALSPLPGLRVAARASAFSLRGKGDSLRDIGEKLNVLTVLEGSVRRAGDRVRITAQLSDVRQGRQLWSERFDRELKDIFDVQDEIAHAIVERLKVTLVGGRGDRLVPKITSNIDAYQLLLKGRLLLTRRGRAIHDAMNCFEQALGLDPDLAEAHALLGDAHRLTALYGLRPAPEAVALARASAERALAIDSRQVEALATLANIATTYDWDLAAGTRLYDRALAIDPSHVRSLAERAIMLIVTEVLQPALENDILQYIHRARELDPLNAWILAVESMGLACLGRLPEAIAAGERAVAMDADNFTAHWTLVVALAWAERHEDALRAAEPALAISGRHPRILTEVASVHATRGDVAAADAIHVELHERARFGHVGLAERAAVAASAGQMDDARRLVAEALTAHDPYLRFWRFPAWRAAWNDPMCAALLRNSGLFN